MELDERLKMLKFAFSKENQIKKTKKSLNP